MNSSDKALKPEATLRDEVANVIAKARAAVCGGSPTETFVAKALETIPSAVERSDDYAPAAAAIQQSIQAAERLQTILRDALQQIEALEAIRARRERYSDRWWQQQRQELSQAFQSDPLAGVDRWLRTYADALLAWELTICEKLAQEALPFPPPAAQIPGLFQQGALAIREERYLESSSMLAYLAQARTASQSSSLLDPTRRALLHVFMGRILLYYSTDREGALADFQQARELAPDDGRVFAALGDYYRVRVESRDAMRFYQQAIERSPEWPDGYLGMGLLAEDQKRWDEAEEWYDRAIETVRDENDVEAGISRLLAPVSGNLYLRRARLFAQEEPELALHLVTQAIERGIKADGDYPERWGYKLKGEALAALRRPAEAAEAFYEAGKRFSWVNEPQTATELLAQAKELNPDDVRIYWSYSEALRTRSYLPDPPYVDKDLIMKSLAVWEQSAKLELPDESFSWAYVGRALINDQMANLANADRWSLWWEAAVHLERAILLKKEDGYRWSYLSRFYRSLEMEANGLEAVNRALEYNSGSDTDLIAVLEEQAAILANIGEFRQAEEAIDKRRNLQPNSWADAVNAYILLHTSRYSEALKLAQGALEAEPKNLWYHELRAHSYSCLGQQSLSEQDYNWILSQYDPSDSNNQSKFGWAAYELGKIDQAISIFRELLEDPTQELGDVHRSLGLCYLAQGQLALGEEYFTQGVALAKNVRELDELLELDLLELEQSTAEQPHGAQTLEILRRLRDRITARRTELERQSRSAEEELRRVIAKLEDKDSWPWLGAQAGLARLCLAAERWSEAAAIYQRLQQQAARFPEGRIGFEQAIEQLQAAGDRCLLTGQSREALDHFTRALELTRKAPSTDQMKQAELHSRQSYARFALADLASARAELVKALELYRASGVRNPGEALGVVVRSLLADVGQYWKLMDACAAFEHEAGTAEALRHDLAAVRRSLAGYLDESYRLSDKAGTGSDLLPVVTPVAVELGSALIPQDTSENWPLLKTYIPEMRDRIEKGMGVQVPGVRFRANNSTLPPEGYLILLDEVPLVSGDVQPGKRYCLAAPAELHKLGIDAQALVEAAHPLTGEPGCWVASDYWETVTSHNLTLWDDPLLFMIFHLEAVLRRNLAAFLGAQEVENLLETWQQCESGASLIKAPWLDQTSRLRLARALRALVRERVPITRWEVILEAVQSAGPASDDVSEAVRAIRLRLKELLPGNEQGAQRLELPSDWEQKAASWLRRENDKVIFTAPPEETHNLLLAIRDLVDTSNSHFALVTRNFEIRPFVRRLIEFEFPDLMALSQEELLTQDDLSASPQAQSEKQMEGANRDE